MLWLATFVIGLLGGLLGHKKLNLGCSLSLLACGAYFALEDFHGFHLFWRAEHVGFYSRHPKRAFDTVLLPVLVIVCTGWVAWHWRKTSLATRGTGNGAGL